MENWPIARLEPLLGKHTVQALRLQGVLPGPAGMIARGDALAALRRYGCRQALSDLGEPHILVSGIGLSSAIWDGLRTSLPKRWMLLRDSLVGSPEIVVASRHVPDVLLALVSNEPCDFPVAWQFDTRTHVRDMAHLLVALLPDYLPTVKRR